MKLNQIADNPGARKTRHRIGRGIGSGCGKTGGRGGKGQTARSGVRIKGFEGGQMPLHRRLPKRGFKNTAFQIRLTEINVGDVQEAIDAGAIDAKNAIDVDTLVKAGVLRRPKGGVKLLGGGEIKTKAEFTVWRASKSAIAAVEKAGGSVKILAPKKEAPTEPKGKNARFAAGLDKPKVFEAAPKADAKGGKADKPKAEKAEKPAKSAASAPSKDAG
ncbi:MAG: 50S ribosomal protein L15 [Pseudorhodoplanes sp.]|nr:50S ribosomal protein L15 [Pseudorhodoplanes sp.]